MSLAGAANMIVSSGPTFQAASTLFRAIEDEFGWSRAVVTGVASLVDSVVLYWVPSRVG